MLLPDGARGQGMAFGSVIGSTASRACVPRRDLTATHECLRSIPSLPNNPSPGP